MATKRSKRLGRVRLRRWLEAKPEGAVVGRTCMNGDCPIARCVIEELGATYAMVSPSFIEAGHDYNYGSVVYREAQPWEQWFIRGVDALSSGYRGHDITREQALAVLAEIGD